MSIVTKTIEKIRGKKSINENIGELKREVTEMREEFESRFSEMQKFIWNEMTSIKQILQEMNKSKDE